MAFKFLLPFGRFNLSYLSKEKRSEVLEKLGLKVIEVVEIFKYEKSNNRYWDKPKLYHQVITKALPIADALYPG